HARDAVEESRLPGAVWPDQGEDLALRDLEAHLVDRRQAPESLDHALQGKARLCFGAHDVTTADSSCTPRLSSCVRRRLGRRPCGRRSMMLTRIKPKRMNLSLDTNSAMPGQLGVTTLRLWNPRLS